jgi:hypothetical protein
MTNPFCNHDEPVLQQWTARYLAIASCKAIHEPKSHKLGVPPFGIEQDGAKEEKTQGA